MQDNAIAPRADTKNRLLALIAAALEDYPTTAEVEALLEGYIPADADLAALAALTGTGLAARTADDTWALRTITGPAAGISVANGGGVAGNPTISLANDLAALEGLGTTGLAVRTGSDTWATRALVQPAAGITISNDDGVAGSPTFALANDLAALEALAGTGLAARTAADTWAQRSLAQPAAGLTISNADGVGGNPTFALANDLLALEGLGGTGFAARTGSDAWAARSLTQPAAGLTISNSDGAGGNPVFALANDLAALEGLAGTGLAARTGSDAWASRSLAQPAAGLTITNPDGVSGNPTFALANDLAALEGLGTTGLAARTGSDTWASRSLAAPAAGITISNADGVSGNPTLALANDLAALEALAGTGLAARTGADTWASRTLQNADGLLSLTNADGVSGNPDISLGDNGLKKAVVTVTNAEILALRATPKTLVAAPGAGKILELVAAFGYCNTAAAAYTNPQQCAIRDNNGTGAIRSGSTAVGFVNTTTPTYAYIAPQNCAPVVNVLLCLHNTGPSEMTGGNVANSMTWHVYYRVLTLP